MPTLVRSLLPQRTFLTLQNTHRINFVTDKLASSSESIAFCYRGAATQAAPTVFDTPHTNNTNPPQNNPAKALLARQVSQSIRLSVREGKFADAFRRHRAFHDNIHPHPHTSPQSRLVTSTLIHSLLRAGRRFKAAQVAESAWVGTSPLLPSLFPNHFIRPTQNSLKLSHKTSEAIILALCPLQSLSYETPLWKLSVRPEEIGKHAPQEVQFRAAGTRTELGRESVLSRTEKQVIPSMAAHRTWMMQALGASGMATTTMGAAEDPLTHPPETLDWSTQRALMFMRVLQQTRQRQTAQMWQGLLDACLLQGEIVVATLLIVLMVRQWQARDVLLNLRAEKETQETLQHSEVGKALQLPGAVSVLETRNGMVGDLEPYSSSSRVAGIPIGSSWKTDDAAYDQADPPGALLVPAKPKHRPKPYLPDPYFDSIQSLINTFVGVITYPSDNPSTGEDRISYHVQPSQANPRYPRPQMRDSVTAMMLLMNSVKQDGWCTASPSLLRTMVEFPEQLVEAEDAATQSDGAELKEAGFSAIQSLIATRCGDGGVPSAPLSLDESNGLLWAAYFGLGSSSEAQRVLKAMENQGLSPDDEETMSIVLTGAAYVSDWQVADSILVRIAHLYESGKVSIDQRVILLLYASKVLDCTADSQITAKAGALKTMLEMDLNIARKIPLGTPTLLNAVLKYFLLTKRSGVVMNNLSALMIYAYEDRDLRRDGVQKLAASFGPDFYHLLLRHMEAQHSHTGIGFAERIWRVARQAEMESWRLSMRATYLSAADPAHLRNARRRNAFEFQPWWHSLDAYKTMMRVYSYAKDHPGYRPGIWRGNRPLDSAIYARPRDTSELGPSEMAYERVMELHDGFMEEPTVTENALQQFWLRNEDFRLRIGEKRANPNTTHSRRCYVTPLPDAEYWRWLWQGLSDFTDLVPIRAAAEAAWPLLVQEGTHLMKIVPYVLDPDSPVRAWRVVVADMHATGWWLGQQVSLDEEEMTALGMYSKAATGPYDEESVDVDRNKEE